MDFLLPIALSNDLLVAVLGIAGTIIGVFLSILSGLLAWLALRIFRLKSDVQRIDQTIRGDGDVDPGHIQQTQEEFDEVYERLDCISESLERFERAHGEQLNMVMERTDKIIEVLQKHNMNGTLEFYEDD